MGIIKRAMTTGIGLTPLAKGEMQKSQGNREMAEQDGERYLKNLQETIDRLQDRIE